MAEHKKEIMELLESNLEYYTSNKDDHAGWVNINNYISDYITNLIEKINKIYGEPREML